MGYTELFVADARLEMDMRIGEQKISILYRDAFTKALLHLFFLFDLFEDRLADQRRVGSSDQHHRLTTLPPPPTPKNAILTGEFIVSV